MVDRITRTQARTAVTTVRSPITSTQERNVAEKRVQDFITQEVTSFETGQRATFQTKVRAGVVGIGGAQKFTTLLGTRSKSFRSRLQDELFGAKLRLSGRRVAPKVVTPIEVRSVQAVKARERLTAPETRAARFERSRAIERERLTTRARTRAGVVEEPTITRVDVFRDLGQTPPVARAAAVETIRTPIGRAAVAPTFVPPGTRRARQIREAQVSPLTTAAALGRIDVEEERVRRARARQVEREFGFLGGARRFFTGESLIVGDLPSADISFQEARDIEKVLKAQERDLRVFGRTILRTPRDVEELGQLSVRQAGTILLTPAEGLISTAGRRVAAKAAVIRGTGLFVTRARKGVTKSLIDIPRLTVQAPGGDPLLFGIKGVQTGKGAQAAQRFDIAALGPRGGRIKGKPETVRANVNVLVGRRLGEVTDTLAEITGKRRATADVLSRRLTKPKGRIEELGIILERDADILKAKPVGKVVTRGIETIRRGPLRQVEGVVQVRTGARRDVPIGIALRDEIATSLGAVPKVTLAKAKKGQLRPPTQLFRAPRGRVRQPGISELTTGLTSIFRTGARLRPGAVVPFTSGLSLQQRLQTADIGLTADITGVRGVTAVTPRTVPRTQPLIAIDPAIAQITGQALAVTPVSRFAPVPGFGGFVSPIFPSFGLGPTGTTPLAPLIAIPSLGFPTGKKGKKKKFPTKKVRGFKPGLKALAFDIRSELTATQLEARLLAQRGFGARPIPKRKKSKVKDRFKLIF